MVRAGVKLITGAGGDVAGIALTMADSRRYAQYAFGDTGNSLGRLNKYYVD
jgi:hypothetical protein